MARPGDILESALGSWVQETEYQGCPFCAEHFFIARQGEQLGLMHTMPLCPTYLQLDADDYLRAIGLGDATGEVN